MLMDGRVRGLVQAQGDVQGRDRHGLEEPVEHRVQEKQRRVPGHTGRSSPRLWARRTREAKYSAAWRRTADRNSSRKGTCLSS